jgi:hypothetical protein
VKNIVKWKMEDNSVAITGNVYYLNTINGDDDNTGLRTTDAFLTQAYAESVMENGDVLLDSTTGSGGNYAELPIVRKITEYLAYKMNGTVFTNDLYSYELKSRDDIIAMATGSTYYFDFNNGNDTTGNGSTGTPWKTLTKALTCAAGSLILLRNGNYGSFSEARTSSRADWLIFMNDVGHSPVITSVNCTSESNYTYDLIFYGISIAPSAVDPGATDSMYAESTQNTYNKTANPFIANYADYISFYNCELVGTNKYLTVSNCYIMYCNYIYFERCHHHRTFEGICVNYSSHVSIIYSNIHNFAGSPINDGSTGNTYITLEGNHMHDCGYSLTDPYSPKASGENAHGSVNICSTYLSMRNNFIHNLGNSRGVYFYPDNSPTYHDITIENNLFYNPHNSICVQAQLVSTNVIFRNNTFVGVRKNLPADHDEYQYQAAWYFSGYQTGYSSGLKVHNNIFVGIAIASGTITADKNICFSSQGLSGTYISAYANSLWSYFETGFFNNGASLNLDYVQSYGYPDTILDFTLADGSPAINYGDINNQPTDSLGTLDENSEFLIPNGIARDSSHHDIGCYQR